MKIAFATIFDLNDVNRGSGTYHYIYRHLKSLGHQVLPIGPFSYSYPFISRLNRYIQRRLHRRYKSFLDPFVAAELGKAVNSRLAGITYDILLTNDLAIAGHVKSSKPIVLYTDAMLEKHYEANKVPYAPLSGLSPLNLYLSKQTVRRGLHNADLVCYPAEWSCERAVEYDLPRSKVHLIPFGANCPDPGRSAAGRHSAQTLAYKERVDLLFIGKDWNAKGGDFALAVMDSLAKQRIAAHLHVVGLSNSHLGERADVTSYGYYDKADPAQMDALTNLYVDCDAFLLPSVYEGFGIAYVEAAAHGLPSLGYKTSGVTTAVLDQVTGRLLDTGTPASEFANVIEQWLHAPLSYQKLAQGARDYFERVVNWECAIAKLLKQIQSFEIPQAPK